MMRAYAFRKAGERREIGLLMSLAFHEPDKITEAFPDPVFAAEPGESELVESEKWW